MFVDHSRKVLLFVAVIASASVREIYGQNLPEGLPLPTTTKKPTTTKEPTTVPSTTTIATTTASTTASTTEIVTTSEVTTSTSSTAKTTKTSEWTPLVASIKRNSKNASPPLPKRGKGKKKEKKKKKKPKPKDRLKMLKKTTKRRMRLNEKSYMKNFLRNCSMLFKSIKQDWREKKRRKKFPTFTFGSNETIEPPPNSFEVVKTMNDFGKNIASMLKVERKKRRRRKEVMPISSDGIEMEVSVVETDGFSGYTFPDQSSQLNVNESIKLPSAIFKGSSAGNGTIISIVYDAFYEMAEEAAIEKIKNASINSKVLSTTVYPHPVGELAEPVEIILTHLQKPNATEPECVFWKVNESNPSAGGHWSTDGCVVHKSNATHTSCHCNHLTDFAVLFRVSKTKKIPPAHKQALTIVSLVGCLVSAVCLMVTVLVLIILRKLLRSTRNLLHLNLAVALLIANILFLISDKVLPVKNLCLAVSICLFYFFLAAFCLMLGEGIYIWIMVAKAFSQNLKKWMYLCIGWGSPLVIVGVSFGILRYDLVATDFCWLSLRSGAIWAFIGPVVLVIAVNFCILMKVLCTAVENQSTDEKFKVSARLTIILMPILGLTWLFGVFSMNEETIVFEYLFTIFNSLQGVFIFICYIAMNGEVKTEYEKLKARKEYSHSLPMKSTSSTATTKVRRSRAGTRDEEEAQMIS
eukprot:Seg4743.1 transcript_id=Seg4743.1/GoldUCD/mRNA.D3Y31 product="Adhesion G protein-coupled receptor L2" protein_id=Seg4743.1/GoldUCD/D3Y31